ncbi:hypothetical protein JCM11251_002415 [Rhodosporidiobolus azoricus]
MLNDDCLRIVVKQAAAFAEADFMPQQPAPLSRFALRYNALAALSLVGPQWKDAAQLELARIVIVSPRNYTHILKVAREGTVFGRVRILSGCRDPRPWMSDPTDPPTLDPILEACSAVEEVICQAWRFSLNSLVGMKHLARLSLLTTTIDGGLSNVVLPARLTHLTLHDSSLEPGALDTLFNACEGNLRYLQPRIIRVEQVAFVNAILSAAHSTLRTLDLRLLAMGDPTKIFGSVQNECSAFHHHLEHLFRLEELHLIVGQSPLARDFLTRSTSAPSLRSLHLHRSPMRAPLGGDAAVWDASLDTLLEALPQPAFRKVEFIQLDVGRATFDPANGGLDGTQLFELQEAARARGIKVSVT